jgi:pyruvate dehydrogenase E2 component (dihydrolipoamide acetyltransferase)
MAIPVIMPKLEMSQEEATIVEWLKREGERVEKGEYLLAVETDKVTVEIESPASGILAGIRASSQELVPVTEIIAYILEPGEKGPPAPAPPVVPPIGGETGGALRATPVAQRLAATHNVDLSAVAGSGTGGRVTKADVEEVLATPSPPPSVPPSGGETGGELRATPAARRVAREHGVDLGGVSGSGPRGRVQAADVLASAAEARAKPTTIPGTQGDVIPLQGMRRTIAERMTTSYRTAPHITLTARVDMTGFEEARAHLNTRAQAAGQAHVSVTALIVKALAWALKRHPWLNSTLRDEAIHLLPEVNIGVAVALPDGLIVPVVHQADRLGMEQIAASVEDLTTRAREARLLPDDVAGGTFTLTNLGPLGIEQFTAIINPPQSAILAVGVAQPEVIPDRDGQPNVRPIMRVTLSADHRVVDGAVAAHFLNDLRQALEAPTLMLW